MDKDVDCGSQIYDSEIENPNDNPSVSNIEKILKNTSDSFEMVLFNLLHKKYNLS